MIKRVDTRATAWLFRSTWLVRSDGRAADHFFSFFFNFVSHFRQIEPPSRFIIRQDHSLWQFNGGELIKEGSFRFVRYILFYEDSLRVTVWSIQFFSLFLSFHFISFDNHPVNWYSIVRRISVVRVRHIKYVALHESQKTGNVSAFKVQTYFYS